MQVCPTSLLQSCSNRLPEDVRHASCLPILLHRSLNTYTHTYTQTTKHHADIKTLKESYIGFLPNESRVFSLDFPESFRLLYSPGSSGKGDMKERIADQLATLCAFLGEFPAIRCHRYMIIPAAYSVIRLKGDLFVRGRIKCHQTQRGFVRGRIKCHQTQMGFVCAWQDGYLS